MNIKHPEFMWLILIIPALIIFLYWVFQENKNILDRLCSQEQLHKIFPHYSHSKTIIRFIILTFALIMLITGLISPRWGYEWQIVEREGTNILVALDSSRSMLADDISPSRLTRAKLEISKLIDKLNGDRIGLLIFAGDSFLQAPLTHDYLMVKNWLQSVSTESIPVPGTSIKSAIELAMKSFSVVNSGDKTLIIISDGEEQDEKTVEIAQKAKEAGIRIISIGIGSEKGAPINYNGELIKDKEGKIVISKLNDQLLKDVSKATDGKYIRSRSGDFHLEQLYFDFIKSKTQNVKLQSGKIQRWFETYQIFISLAVLALLLELFLGMNFSIFAFIAKLFRRNNKHNIFEASKLYKTIVLLAFGTSLWGFNPVRASLLDWNLIQGDKLLQDAEFEEASEYYVRSQANDPHNPRLNYNLGVAEYKQENYLKALNSFNQSVEDAANYPSLQERAFYNQGNAYFKLEDYREAIKAYENALKLNPEDKEAQFNLELAKKMLPEQEKKEDENQDDKKQDQKKDQEQKKDKDNKNSKDKKDQKQDKNQEQNNGKQNQKQQEKNPEQDLDKQELENLLRQVQDGAEKGQPQKQRPAAAAGNNKKRDLKPW